MNKPPSFKATASVNAIIRKLGSRRAAIRQQAERDIKELSPEQVDALVRIVRENVFADTMKPGRVDFFGTLSITMLPVLLSFILDSQLRHSPISPFIFPLTVIYDGIFASLFIAWRVRLRKSIVRAATLVQDVKLLGPLITISITKSTPKKNKMYSWLGGYVYEYPAGTAESAIRSMSEILQHATLEDNLDVTGQEFKRLAVPLCYGDAETVLRILPMLETISETAYFFGTGLVLSTVRMLKDGMYSGSGHPAVREAAAHCLSTMEARMAGRLISGTLLRASQADTHTQTLVRPVEFSRQDEQAVLLRADRSDK